MKLVHILSVLVFALPGPVTHAGWSATRGLDELIIRAPSYEFQQLLSALNKMGFRLSDDLSRDLRESMGDPSKLLVIRYRGIETIKPQPNHHEAWTISRHRSPIITFEESDIIRIFFFLQFDPSDLRQMEKLFIGFVSHLINTRPGVSPAGFDEIQEISTRINLSTRRFNPSTDEYFSTYDDFGNRIFHDVWVPFKNMTEEVVSEGFSQTRPVDIEAGFLSALGPINDFEFLGATDFLNHSFRAFTDRIMTSIEQIPSAAERSRKLVELYRSPYFNLPEGSPYRIRFFSMLKKENLIDEKMVLKWWEDAEILAKEISNEIVRGYNDPFEFSIAEAISMSFPSQYLKKYIQTAVDGIREKNKSIGVDTIITPAVLQQDPFMSALFQAQRENDTLNQAVNNAITSVLAL